MINFKRIITTSLVASALAVGFGGADTALASPEDVLADGWNQFDIDHDVRCEAPDGTNIAMCLDLGVFSISLEMFSNFDFLVDSDDDLDIELVVSEDD